MYLNYKEHKNIKMKNDIYNAIIPLISFAIMMPILLLLIKNSIYSIIIGILLEIGIILLDNKILYPKREKKLKEKFYSQKETIENIKEIEESKSKFNEVEKEFEETREKTETQKDLVHKLTLELSKIKKQIQELKNKSYEQLIGLEEIQKTETNQQLALK